MSYEYAAGLGTNLQTIDMDFATAEDLEAAGVATPAAAGEKTSLFDEIEATLSSFWEKTGDVGKVAMAAESIAREEGGAAKAVMAPAEEPVPAVQPAGPTAPSGEDTGPSWAVRYAPHLILGGLGAGAVAVLVLAIRKV